MTIHRLEVPTPFGPVVLLAGAEGLRTLLLPPLPPHRRAEAPEALPSVREEAPPSWLASIGRRVHDYLLGHGPLPEAPLDLRGSPFALTVWAAARRIAYGTTVTYGELAAGLGDRRLARAVGRALARNPVPLFVPCHRVVAAGGLGGFSAGPAWKRLLLDLESRPRPPRSPASPAEPHPTLDAGGEAPRLLSIR